MKDLATDYQGLADKVVEVAEDVSTKGRLVEAARELFLLQGFEKTSVKEILNKAGVNSGSLYYFFPKKEDLLVEVLEKYKTLLWPMVIDPVFQRVNDPIDRVFEILNGYRQMLEMTQFTHGCPIGNLALEMSERSDLVRQGIADNFEGWQLAVRQCFEDAGERLPQCVDRDKLATFVLTTMEGGVMLARAYRRIEPFDDGVDMLRLYISQLLAGPENNSGN